MSGARFHFDPTHDPAQAPSHDDLRRWIAARMDTPGSYLHMGTSAVVRIIDLRPGWSRTLAGLLPAWRRHRIARERRRCLDAALLAVTTTRDVMLEFGVDLTVHPTLSGTFEAIAAVGVLGINERGSREFVERARAEWDYLDEEIDLLDQMLDRMDTEMRATEYEAQIRADLEAEALHHLVMDEDPALTAPMRIAALRAAVDEVRQVNLRQAVVTLLARIDPNA